MLHAARLFPAEPVRRAGSGIAGFSAELDVRHTRPLPSIATRRPVARRCDHAHLAGPVLTHRYGVADACEVAHDLAHPLAEAARRP